MLPRTSYVIILAVLATTAQAQEAAKVCADARTIKITSQWDQLTATMSDVEAAAQPLHYFISRTQGVQGAWIEVWDRPKRLSRQSVSIKREGEAGCNDCQSAEVTPEELYISIFDPEVPLMGSDDIPSGQSGPPGRGDYVSEVRAGKKPDEESDESQPPPAYIEPPAYLMDYPALTAGPIRVEEGSGSTSVVLAGENLIPSSRVYLLISENAPPKSKASRIYLYSRTLDLHHVQVTIPAYYLEKSGVLTAYAKDAWEREKAEESGSGQKIIVASKDSPVIDSVEPQVLRSGGLDATVVLRGSGFTEASEAMLDDDIGPWTATFVSPRELHIEIPAGRLEVGPYARAAPVTISVINDPLHVSAPVKVQVAPSAKFKRQPLPAVLSVIAPYPVPMMDLHSPRFLTLEINGDNLRPDDVVSFHNGYHDYKRLRTQYVSAHHLRAWLPRESWREHRLSFRLVVLTSAGLCAAEAFAK